MGPDALDDKVAPAGAAMKGLCSDERWVVDEAGEYW